MNEINDLKGLFVRVDFKALTKLRESNLILFNLIGGPIAQDVCIRLKNASQIFSLALLMSGSTGSLERYPRDLWAIRKRCTPRIEQSETMYGIVWVPVRGAWYFLFSLLLLLSL